jgi:enolase-phosphatase E1
MIRAILTDLEGTTTPIAFVHRVLFPYARQALPALIETRAHEPEVAAALEATRAAAPGAPPLSTLQQWMAADAKATPLKALQGIAWAQGYATGAIRGELYPDVSPRLAAWRAAGLTLAVYSSGSEQAQRLLFRHAPEGDLEPLFAAFFDTRVGAKTEPASYTSIAARLGMPASAILFLSDRAAELDAAATAGMATCQLLRPEDGATPSPAHRQARSFDEIDP